MMIARFVGTITKLFALLTAIHQQLVKVRNFIMSSPVNCHLVLSYVVNFVSYLLLIVLQLDRKRKVVATSKKSLRTVSIPF
jgi:hypothetical protein